MSTSAAFDSNVVLYLFGSDEEKASRSELLIRSGGVVSVQVLNEITLVARRKMRKTWPEIHEMLIGIRAKCTVSPVTLEVHDRGVTYAEQLKLNVFDAMIVASAVLSGCVTLYTEDMHDGLVIDGLTIRNPY